MYEAQSIIGLSLTVLVALVAAWMCFARAPRIGVVALENMRQTQLRRLMGVGLAVVFLVLVVVGIRSFQNRGVGENVVYDRAAYFYQGREVQITSQEINRTVWGEPVAVTYKLWVQGIGAIEGKCSQPNIFMSPSCEFSHEE